MNDGLETRIQGIPCRVVVTGYTQPVASNPNFDPLNDPYDPGEFTFAVYDRRGYPAKWLERMMTDQDIARIYKEYTQ